jgi:hypothetical protein
MSGYATIRPKCSVNWLTSPRGPLKRGQGKLIVQRKRLTVLIYFLAALAASFFWVIHQEEGSLSASLTGSFLVWLLLLAAPLLFVFAYPGFLFGPFAPQTSRPRYAAFLHGLAAAITTVLFVILGSVFWKNPLRDGDSFLLPLVPIIAAPVFFVAALSLLLKDRSTLAKLASFLFWPYLLFVALISLNRFFEASTLRTTVRFFSLLSSVLFAFAAGAISPRPTLAHSSALAGLLAVPYVYWTTLQDTPLGNTWTMCNESDRKFVSYMGLHLRASRFIAFAKMPSEWKPLLAPAPRKYLKHLCLCFVFFLRRIFKYEGVITSTSLQERALQSLARLSLTSSTCSLRIWLKNGRASVRRASNSVTVSSGLSSDE